jgi:hypothetical protein
MAHFARVEDNIVTQVLVIPDSQEDRGNDYLSLDLGLGGSWYKTSYNTIGGVHVLGGTPYRKNYAGIGYTFDSNRQAFIAPKPFASWVLDEETCLWEAPVAYPTDDQAYTWDENTTSWALVTE